MRKLRRISLLGLILVPVLFAYQNCGDIKLLGVASQEAQVDVTPPTLPDLSDPPDETTTTTTTVPTRDCGSYLIEKVLVDDALRDYFEFSALENVSGGSQPISGSIQWSTIDLSGRSVPSQPHKYRIDVPDSCVGKVVTARFTNRCGEIREVSSLYTLTGCPPPQTGNPSCGERHKIPQSSILTNASVKTPSAGSPLINNKNVQTINAAYAHQQYNPATQIYPQHAAWITIPERNYLAMSFQSTATPAGNGKSVFKIEWEQPGQNAGIVLVSVSDCPGDFYIGRDAKGCLSKFNGVDGIYAYVGRGDAGKCILDPNKTYYLNVTTQDPRDNWSATPLTEVLILFDHEYFP